MRGSWMNPVLLALCVAMMAYHGQLCFIYRLAFRFAFLAFWVLLGFSIVAEERWPLIPAGACLILGIWKRGRILRDVVQALEGDESAGETLLGEGP